MKEAIEGPSSQQRELGPVANVAAVCFPAVAITLAVLQIFSLKPFGFILIEPSYLYCLIAFFVSLVFILWPATRGARRKPPWYDYCLFFLCFGISLYFASASLEIISRGWEFAAPLLPTLMSVGLWMLVLEAVRRTTGIILASIVTFFSLFPIFCAHMPGFLEGCGFTFLDTAIYHVMSTESLLGIPMRVVGTLLIGFMLFGSVLQATGGGRFFLDFSKAVLGKYRGGPAKVAVMSSALFGSMSGSVISNVVVTGQVTIPAMKRTGYPPHYAGAIEAVSSTGGALMPPVMGAVGFVMASMLGIPYATVIVAAAVPALLYYGGLLFQIDSYAAKVGIKGLPETELPSLRRTLKEGWFYISALIVMIILIFLLKREGQAPFYAMLALLFCAMLRKETRLDWKRFIHLIAASGRVMAEITAILAAVGLVIGSLSMTGVAHAFSREFVAISGGNVALLLILGALTSAILGIGMTAVPCYVFLSITLAPALGTLGFNLLATHLFVLYWGLVSFITPPVAVAAIAAAPIAGANAIKTGFAAMRLGSVIYFIPFFFVLNPALILIGSPVNIILSVITAFIGVYLIASSLEGYTIGIGKTGLFARVVSASAGLAIFAPWRTTEAIGAILIVLLLVYGYLRKR